MSRWLEQLNPEQQEAVQHIDGPLLVLAGAGSGKTRVITHRIAYLIEHGVPARQILAVTFTNKAAEEMQQRLRRMVDKGADAITMGTFHALGLTMLRHEGSRHDRFKKFTVFDTSDQMSVLREIGRRLKFERSFDLPAVLQRISAYKNNFIAVDETPDSEDPYDQAAGIFYPYYEELLQAYAAVDFDDLICLPAKLLEQSADTRVHWAQRFSHILVDEYQDTNAAQFRLLKALTQHHQNLCVVGDDDQSIYGWRGAQVTNILHFDRYFKNPRVVYLQRNYRSQAPILDVANSVIAQNTARFEKKLIAAKTPPASGALPVRLVVAPNDDSEMGWVAQHVRQMIDLHRYRPKEIAILYRSNLLAQALETELRQQNIPYRMLGGTAFYESKEVKDLLAYLRVCQNPADEISLRRIINTPPRGIGPKTVAKLSDWALEHRVGLFAALQHATKILGATDRSATAIEQFLTLIEDCTARCHSDAPLDEAASHLVGRIGLKDDIVQHSSSDKAQARRISVVDNFLVGVQLYVKRVAEPSLRDYLQRVTLASMAEDEEEDEKPLITLSTLHGAKGLEFRLVIMIGLEEGLLPHNRTLNPQAHDIAVAGGGADVSEERRLCYVGMTRAMDELILTRAAERMMRGKLQPRMPSRFLDEVPPEKFALEDLNAAPPMEQVRSMMDSLRAKLGPALGCLLLLLMSCAVAPKKSNMTQAHKNQTADRIFINGHVITNDPTNPTAQAVGVNDGQIVAVGTNQAITALASDSTQTTDLHGATLLPGLVDAHGHVAGLGTMMVELDVTGCKSFEEVQARVKDYAAKNPQGWIVGRGWDQSLWPVKEFPDGRIFEQVVPGRQVWLVRVDGHAGLASPAALHAAKIDERTTDPAGGRILRDKSGHASGVLIDEAMPLVSKHLPPPTRQERKRRALLALKKLGEVGLTAVHDMAVSHEMIGIYRELEQDGQLPIRIYAVLNGEMPELPQYYVAGRYEGPRLTIRAVKFFGDGALGSRGAALLDDYSDEPKNRGLELMTRDAMTTAVQTAVSAGFQPCIHAIGDRGNRTVLDVFEAVQKNTSDKNLRARIEHAQIIHPSDIARFAALNVIASMQPTHATTDMRFAETRLGPDRLAGAYAWQSIARSGAVLAFGSDFPIEPPPPLAGIYAAITRMNADGQPAGGWRPTERLTFTQALAAFTSGAAYASFTESNRGQIRVGFDADFTIVDGDLSKFIDKISASLRDKLLNAAVIGTVVAGKTIHARTYR